jgi:hypothetical protein
LDAEFFSTDLAWHSRVQTSFSEPKVVLPEFIPLGPVPESRKLRLERLFPGSVVKLAAKQVLVPRPLASSVPREELADKPLLDWATRLVSTIFAPTKTAE